MTFIKREITKILRLYIFGRNEEILCQIVLKFIGLRNQSFILDNKIQEKNIGKRFLAVDDPTLHDKKYNGGQNRSTAPRNTNLAYRDTNVY